jgi:hypothetical protein
MKKLILSALVLVVSSQANAGMQTIACKQVNKNGSVSAKGIKLKMQLEFFKNGKIKSSEVQMAGVFKAGSDLGKELSQVHGQQGVAIDGSEYGTLFFDDMSDGGRVEYQLQFKKKILMTEFSNVPASLVVGVENNSTDEYPNWGYDLKCSGKLE